MVLTASDIAVVLALAGSGIAGGAVAWRRAWKRAESWQNKRHEALRQVERESGQKLWFATLESLAHAIEARNPFDIGHLACVQKSIQELTQSLCLPAEEADALRAAALLHNVGRLGMPEYLLNKTTPLSPEEQEKLQTHPVLGARILEDIPFAWPVLPLIRHHAEHWDGSGYPDGLQGDAIPRGARILAVANSYSALLLPRPFRAALSPEEAWAEIESRSGTQFDPEIVAAFRTVASCDTVPHPPSEAETRPVSEAIDDPLFWSLPLVEARSAQDDIAAAQRETLGLYTLAQAAANALHIEALGDTLLHCIRDIVPCAACVLFLPEDDGEYLRAQAALGVNARHLLGSLARVGTYLTGRAFSRGEMKYASFLHDDLALRHVSTPWTPFRSTLIVPLMIDGQALGTLNLYAEEPEAFGADALRIMRLVGEQASRALDNVRRFTDVQETAYTDALTGLRNARFLRAFLDQEINRSRRENMPLAVLNIDLDNFKPINDGFGHARGDQTLREIAAILQAHVRNYDLAARYAGDEFVIVLSRAGQVAAETVAEKLKQEVDRHSLHLLELEPHFPKLGISIGIALFPEDGEDLQSLLCRSDAAMYTDKQIRKAGAGR